MAPRKSVKQKPPAPRLIRTVTLTEPDARALDGLAQDAADWIGRPASGSAVVRALIRYANTQAVEWQRETLFPFMEEEIAHGTTWGGKR